MKLYELSDQYKKLMTELEGMEDGVINEEWIKSLDSIQDATTNKMVNIALAIKNYKAEEETLKKHQDEVSRKRERLNAKVDWLRYYAQHHMTIMNVKEIKDALVTIKIKKCPLKVDFDDEKLVPDDYLVITKRVDKLKLKQDLEKGIQLDGIRLIQSETLEIR